jgi:hypothetical protein
MSLNVGDQEYNSGKKYRQKGTLCGPNRDRLYLHFEVGDPTFFAASNLNLSTFVVRFLPFLMDGSA